MAGPRFVDIEGLRRLERERLQVVEVLDAEEYRWAHLPGAVQVPLEEFAGVVPEAIDPRRPVAVYCNDFL